MLSSSLGESTSIFNINKNKHLAKSSHPILSIATDCTYASNYFHPGFYENLMVTRVVPISFCLSGLCINLSDSFNKIIDLTDSPGSINTPKLTQSKNYRLSRYLRIHNAQHQKILEDLFDIINQNINRYLLTEISFSDLPFDQIKELLSTLLQIDGYTPLPKEMVIAMLQNFLKDYNRLSNGSWLRSPCNYLFDYHRLEGIQFNQQLLIFVASYEYELSYNSDRIAYSGIVN